MYNYSLSVERELVKERDSVVVKERERERERERESIVVCEREIVFLYVC